MLSDGEVVIHEEGASHFHNYIAIGGSLQLTNKRLLFTSNSKRQPLHTVLVNLNEIATVELFKTLLINPNGMTLLLRNGDIQNFIVDDRKQWQDRIQSCLTEFA
ncbi:MAG: hypothetical protein ACKVOR_06555 [Flavobacteriales bacterium]